MPSADAGSSKPPGRGIAWAGAALLLTVVLVVGAVLGALHLIGVAPSGERLQRGYELAVPGPALQSAPQPELDAYVRGQQRRLDGLGWVDAERRIAHIPIADAMALTIQRAASAAEGIGTSDTASTPSVEGSTPR